MVIVRNMLKSFVFIYFFASCITGYYSRDLNPSEYYNVLVPGKLRANAIHYVTVSIVAPESTVTASIIGQSGENNSTKYSETVTVPENQTVIIPIKVGELPKGDYKLFVESSGGINFTQTTDLNLDSLHKLAFIQTDKAIYKPGQKVLFRVIIVDQELRPLSDIKTKTIIKDSKQNIIFSLDNTTRSNGLITGELQLSSEPLLGDWNIHVTGDDLDQSKSFKIDEYIPPNFNVEIKFPKLVTKNTTSFVIGVEAKYTYGKAVKGELNLKVSDAYYSFYRSYPSDGNKRVEFLTDINGIANVEIETKDFLDTNNFYDSKEYRVNATVRDYLTDKSYSKTANFKVYNDRFKLSFIESKNFVAGFPYSVIIKIAYPNDELLDTNEPVKIIYGFGYQDGKQKRETTVNPVNGILKVDLDTSPFEAEPVVLTSTFNGTKKTIYLPVKDSSSTIKVDAEFKGQKYSVGHIYKSSIGACYVQLRLKTSVIDPKFKIGDEVEFLVETQNPIKEFVYHVITKYGAIKSEKVQNSNTFTVKLTEETSPKTRILVHFDCNGTLANHNYDLSVDGVVKTLVNIKTDLNETKPGKPINIEIQTKPETTVALLGIDQRILLLKSGNDISKDDLVRGSEKYLGCKGQSYFGSCSSESYHYWTIQPTPWEIRNSGFILLSNKYNLRGGGSYPPVPIAISSDTGLRGGLVPLASPPQASPGFSGSSSKTQSSQKLQDIRVRKEFPETWLWELVDSDNSGKASISKKVPDSITNWVITGFGINKQDGLSLSNTANLNDFRQFFIKLSLPYSMIRGEILLLEVIVYNYFKTPQTTDVTLYNNNDEFEFVVGSNDDKTIADKVLNKSKQITIPANDGAQVTFLIRPKRVGYINLDLSAITDVAGDRISEKLLVKPEGETHYKSKPLMISMSDSKVKRSVEIEMPDDIVPESEHVTVDTVGDVLGQQINSLENLLRIPYGCGEQNMINLVPNILTLVYLTKTNKLTKKIEEKALSNMKTGYQRELTYSHDDGSFSAFGKADKGGSTWLTAFVMKSFNQATPFMEIDGNVIKKASEFLRSKQNADGSFREDGRVLSSSMQSGTSGDTGSLSAYILIALQSGANASDNTTAKAEEYLISRLQKTNDNYEVVIITYALHLVKSAESDKAFEKLQNIKTEDKDFMYWKQNTTRSTHAQSIEMTSYALMTYILRNQAESGLPILRWLISKQNSKGGFSSTQDTVIGMQALASFASEFKFYEGSMLVEVKTDEDKSHSINVTPENAIVLQQIILDRNTRNVSLTATGTGTAVVRVSWHYNIITGAKKPAFSLKHEYTETNSAVTINVCSKYLAGNESGMTLLEVTLPSGVTADLETFDELKKNLVKRVETKLSNTVIVVYFDKLTKDEVCVPFVGNKVNKIANQMQMPITIYDYYDQNKKVTVFYQPNKHTTCELCDEKDCGPTCQP